MQHRLEADAVAANRPHRCRKAPDRLMNGYCATEPKFEAFQITIRFNEALLSYLISESVENRFAEMNQALIAEFRGDQVVSQAQAACSIWCMSSRGFMKRLLLFTNQTGMSGF